MKLVSCRRCGQQNLAWVQSKRTGRYYLAKTQNYRGMPADGVNAAVRGGVSVLAHRPHKCDEDRPVCEVCGYRHNAAWAMDDCQWRQRGGRIVEDGQELLYRGESPKIVHDEELPRILREDWEKGKK